MSHYIIKTDTTGYYLLPYSIGFFSLGKVTGIGKGKLQIQNQ